MKFKDHDTGHRIIKILLELERKAPNRFAFIVEKIQSIFEEINTMIGNSTLMGSQDTLVHRDCENLLDFNYFMERRFQNQETGRQIIVTLMEIEARDEDLLYTIENGIELVAGDIFSNQEQQQSQALAKILPFQRRHKNM